MARLRLYNLTLSASGRDRRPARRRIRRGRGRLSDEALITLIFAALLVAGLTALLWSPRAALISGGGVCAAGLAGLAWRAWRWRLAVVERERIREADRRRAIRREERRR